MRALLLSGGMDSIALAFWKRPEIAFTVDYGQAAASAEVAAASQVCDELGIAHQLLITLAGMRAVGLGVRTILMGSVASDGTHADGRRDFYEAMDRVMCLQEGSIGVEAPALGMTTVELVRLSGVPKELLAWAHSCHLGPLACGGCRGCVKHYEVTKVLFDDAY